MMYPNNMFGGGAVGLALSNANNSSSRINEGIRNSSYSSTKKKREYEYESEYEEIEAVVEEVLNEYNSKTEDDIKIHKAVEKVLSRRKMNKSNTINAQKQKLEEINNPTKLQNALYDKIIDRLNNAVDNGQSYVVVYCDGYHKLDNNALAVANRLCEAGYFVRTGWSETTPAGNDRPFICCSLKEFPKKSFFEQHSLEIMWFCIFGLIGLITLILMLCKP